MPLLDHFHPPLRGQRHWESFHARWAAAIADGLNTRLLPAAYFAEVQVHIGGRVEVDVGTFTGNGADGGHENTASVGVATATSVWAPPQPILQMPAVFPDAFEVLVYSESGGPTLVAAVELVSPGNKDRGDARRAFAAKCASYLQAGIGLVVIDIVTERHANLHDELIRLLEHPSSLNFPIATRLYAVAYRPSRQGGSDHIDVWGAALAVGEPLPTLPLAVRGLGCLPLALEESYSEARQMSRLA